MNYCVFIFHKAYISRVKLEGARGQGQGQGQGGREGGGSKTQKFAESDLWIQLV